MPAGNLHAVARCLHRLVRPVVDDAPSDRALLERFVATRDADAFAAIVERHGPLVWGVCRRALRRSHDAEEVFQATFLVLIRKAGAVRWRSSISGWLFQVASRLAKEQRKKDACRQAHERRAAELRTRKPDDAGRELAALLDEELQRLPEKYRTPMLLCYLEGLTGDGAAKRLGWSLRTLERRLAQGRELLRNRLARKGITLSAALLAPALVRAAVPPLLFPATVEAGIAFGTGVAGTSANAVALAQTFLKGMVMSKWKALVVVTLALTATTGGGALVVRTVAAGAPNAIGAQAAAAEPEKKPPLADKPSASADQPQPVFDHFAKRAWTIMEVVEKKHLEPCPRSELIVAGVASLCDGAKIKPPTDLARRAATISSADQLASLLKEVWPQVLAASPKAQFDEEVILSIILARVPGGAQLAPIPDPNEQKKEQKINEQISGNRYVGIGIQLRVDPKQGLPQIVSAMRRGAARKAGIKPDDLIEKVDGKDTREQPLNKVVDWLRGEEGTKVTVVVRQPGAQETRICKLTRAVVPFDHVFGYRRASEDTWDFHAAAGEPIAYVRLGPIVSSSLHELRQVERRLKSEGFRALVLDLRFGVGGSLPHVALVADGLLDGGLMWRIPGPPGKPPTEFRADRECLFREWPMVVLVDESLSRAGGLLAAALQDNGRAILVGSETKADGYIASMVEVPGEKTLLVLPVARFERPAKERGWPVKPDKLVLLSPGASDSVPAFRDPPLRKPKVVLPQSSRYRELMEWHHFQEIDDRPIDPKAKPPADAQLTAAVELLRETLKKSASVKNR